MPSKITLSPSISVCFSFSRSNEVNKSFFICRHTYLMCFYDVNCDKIWNICIEYALRIRRQNIGNFFFLFQQQKMKINCVFIKWPIFACNWIETSQNKSETYIIWNWYRYRYRFTNTMHACMHGWMDEYVYDCIWNAEMGQRKHKLLIIIIRRMNNNSRYTQAQCFGERVLVFVVFFFLTNRR